jgi:heat-inducible transcriptional repressor
MIMKGLVRGERSRRVLEAVILEYIKGGVPVGSRAIVKRYGLSVSPATIRNVMADLEELGLLYQPHTSAGRVPTELGLRVYIDSILKIQQLSVADRERIRSSYRGGMSQLEGLLKETSKVLSSFSKQAGLVLTPRFSQTIFKRIEFIRLRSNMVMTILVSQAGIVHNTIFEVKETISQDELDKYSRYLNEMLRDLTLVQVKGRLLEEMKKEKVLFDHLLSKVLELSQKALAQNIDESELYIGGRTNLLDNPEFTDVEQMRRVFRAFEEKSKIIDLLDKSISEEGISIFIGSESELMDMESVSFITSPYARGDELLGTLGVIGPTRMDYSRIIPLVDYTAKLLSEMLEEAF